MESYEFRILGPSLDIGPIYIEIDDVGLLIKIPEKLYGSRQDLEMTAAYIRETIHEV